MKPHWDVNDYKWQIGNYVFFSYWFMKLLRSYYFEYSETKRIYHAICRLGQTNSRAANQVEENPRHRHTRTNSAPTRDLASFADEYRKLSIDCLKILRVEMQLETIFHMQV